MAETDLMGCPRLPHPFCNWDPLLQRVVDEPRRVTGTAHIQKPRTAALRRPSPQFSHQAQPQATLQATPQPTAVREPSPQLTVQTQSPVDLEAESLALAWQLQQEEQNAFFQERHTFSTCRCTPCPTTAGLSGNLGAISYPIESTESRRCIHTAAGLLRVK